MKKISKHNPIFDKKLLELFQRIRENQSNLRFSDLNILNMLAEKPYYTK